MNFMLLDQAAGEVSGGTALLMQLLPLGLVLVVFYFLLIRPQKKQEKKVQEMRNSVEVGDEVVTSGGVIGRVVSIREDTILMETGTDRAKLRIARWAISANNTVHDAIVEKDAK